MIKSILYRYYNNKQNSQNNFYISFVREKLYQLDILNLKEIKQIQDFLLNKSLLDAYNHSRFYKNIFQKYGVNPNNLESFQNIPILDKQIINNNKNAIEHKKKNYIDHILMNTGGSTGQPFEFLRSPLTGIVDSIHQTWQFEMMGYNKQNDVILGFGGATIPQENINKGIFFIPIHNAYSDFIFSSIYLNNKTIHTYIQNIQSIIENKTSILRGYPSFIYDLASYILQNNISLNSRIKGVELTSENAFDWQIEIIKKAFCTDVYFQYGNSETSIFAYSQKNSWEYFCSPLYSFVEVLDENQKHVRIGEEGDIITTGYFNYVFPFIRYKTGDRAIYGGKTENGITILKRLTGRSQDIIYDEKGNKVALTAIVFGQHYKAFANIKRWQIEQNEKGKILIRIVRGDNFSKVNEIEIVRKFEEMVGIKTQIEYVEDIPLTARGKFLFLVQNLK